MQAAADEETTAATDLAEFLVRSGMPFREAHAVVGAHVRAYARRAGLACAIWSPPTRVLGPDAAALVRPGVGVRMRTSRGGAGPEALGLQLESYRAMLADERTSARRLNVAAARVVRARRRRSSRPTAAEQGPAVAWRRRRRGGRAASSRSRRTHKTTRRATRYAASHAPQRGDVRPGRASVRVPQLRHPPLRQRRHRRRTAWAPRS